MPPKVDSAPATITALQDRITAVASFRISFSRLGSAKLPIEPNGDDAMAPSTWRISARKRVRPARYVALFWSVKVYRGHETVVESDIRPVALRDANYAAKDGSLAPVRPDEAKPQSLDNRREPKTIPSKS